MSGKIRIKLLHNLVFILLQPGFHYGCHSRDHVNGSLRRLTVRRHKSFHGGWALILLIVHCHIYHPVYLQRVHVILPRSYEFVFSFDKLDLGIGAFLIIIVVDLCHRSFLVV
jgi:hypothetical protein